MAPPVLKKKLRKVQEMRTDSPALLEALDALATFYVPESTGDGHSDGEGKDGDAASCAWNTLEARRNLRSNLEERGLRLVDEFIAEFNPIDERINLLKENVDRVHDTCDELSRKLEESALETNKFSDATKALTSKRSQVAERAQVMDTFLRRFKLSDQQLEALNSGPSDSDGGAFFFSALEDVQRIRNECQSLISSQFQSAGLELFEAMAAFQEQAYEQLYGWVQSQCAAIDGEFPEPSEALERGIATLVEAPAYLDYARDCIAETRSTSLARRFAIAITQGGPNGNPRPIEMHAHDPLRYIGDMLAWIHQNMAVESSLVKRLFKDEVVASKLAPAEERTETIAETENTESTESSSASKNTQTLDRIFVRALEILSERIRQVFASTLPLVTVFKLGDLLEYYRDTFVELLHSPNGTTAAQLSKLRIEASEVFFESVKAQCGKLLASPPAYPRDLSVALEVSEIIRRLAEVLKVRNEAPLTSLAERSASLSVVREEKFAPVLDAFIEPVLQMCRQSASGLDRGDAAVYIINNLVAISNSLTCYDFTVKWVQRLAEELGEWTDLLVKEQANSILRRCGLAEKMELIERGGSSEGLANQPGMDLESLRHTLENFYKSMFSLVMPEFDRITSSRLRTNARTSTAREIATAYESFYAAVRRPTSGYTQEQLDGVLLHSPDQVRQLLDA